MTTPNTTSFVVYRWASPQTTSDYPFLAVAQDKSALLSLGDYGATLDWGIPDEATSWLARDFTPTGEILLTLLSMGQALRTLARLPDARAPAAARGAANSRRLVDDKRQARRAGGKWPASSTKL